MPTNTPRLLLSSTDYQKLSALVISYRASGTEGLEEEIGRALVMPSHELPHNVVAMGSYVKVRDLETGAEHDYQLVFPHDSDAKEGRISILAPLGVALIGLQTGEEYEFQSPNGRMRRFQVLGTVRPEEPKKGETK